MRDIHNVFRRLPKLLGRFSAASGHRFPGGAQSKTDDAVCLRLPVRDVDALYPRIAEESVMIMEYAQVYGEMPLSELEILCRLAKAIRPRSIFEIGTFVGGTTLHLAANTPAHIYTLDLDPRDYDERKSGHGYDPESDVFPDEVGMRFKQSEYAGRIDQFLCDSAQFDYAPFARSVDFVFVDGCHQYEYVLGDSASALEMVAGGGVVLWHDYAAYEPGVVQALNGLGKTIPLTHIKGTSLVIHQAT